MKNPIFPILVIFILLLIGCSTSTSKPQEIDIFVGTEGLTTEFAKGAPPQKVFESSNFPILLKIRNNGAYSIKEGQGSLGALMSIGREKDYVTKLTLEKASRISSGSSDNEVFFYVDGKTQINPKGDEVIASLNAETGKLDPQSEQRLSTITTTLCYPYKTTLSTTVCIDPDVAGIRPGKKVCNVKEIAFGNGQGAPIAITKIEPQMVLQGDNILPQFLIYIENRGKGNPVNIVGFHNVCRKTSLTEDEIKYTWNVAFLKAFSSGNEQLVCCPNIEGKCEDKETAPEKITGFIRFRDKKDFVKCTFKNSISKNLDSYTSPLRIEVDYGYVQTIATNFIIQKPLKY